MKLALPFILLVAAVSLLALGRPPAPPENAVPVLGDPRTLRAGYERWLSARAEQGSLDRIELPLGWSKGRSVAFTSARGRVTLDLADRTVAVEVSGLESGAPLEVWLVEYRPDRGAAFDERHVRIGALEVSDGRAELFAPLASDPTGELELERVVVARAGAGPVDGGLLFASPGLFERLASRDLRAREPVLGGLLLAAATRAPVALPTAPPTDEYTSLASLVARGEALFFEETFEGNGRTCGTCHPAENNTTLDPAWIATLPDDDPLFVAETVPALNSELNGGLVFEDPLLMRRHGLVVVNADGFGDLRQRYVLRGVQHVLGLVRTIAGPVNGGPPLQRTGWGGDGAPGTGTLREFATGAVVQHLPRTLGRVAGVDFRLPTPDELNALEAFQLSLGSPVDPDVSAITLLDPDAETGRALFGNAVGTCFLCHFDAGALAFASTTNRSLDTGVEAFTRNHPDGTGRPRPPDGGFGLTPGGGFAELVRNPDGSFGNGRFSTVSLIEAADTLPAFHSNVTNVAGSGLADTIEGAVRFYDSEEFDAAPGVGDGNPVELDDQQIAQLGAFLRALNALENERAARSLGERASEALLAPAPELGRVARMAELAGLECEDGFIVLDEVGMNPMASQLLDEARRFFERARSGAAAQRLVELRAALDRLGRARRELVIE